MGMHSRLALLLLTAISAVANPPGRPPGAGSKIVPVRTLPCPKDDCNGRGQWQGGYRYSCDECNAAFYYCTACPSELQADEAAEHKHALS